MQLILTFMIVLQERQDKRLSQRNKLINSILEENNRRMEIEARVGELEKEEYELI